MLLTELHSFDQLPLMWQIVANTLKKGKPVRIATGANGDITAVAPQWVRNETTLVQSGEKIDPELDELAVRVTFTGSTRLNRAVVDKQILLPPSNIEKLTLKSIDGVLTIVNKQKVNEAVDTSLPIEVTMAQRLLDKGQTVYFGMVTRRGAKLTAVNVDKKAEDKAAFFIKNLGKLEHLRISQDSSKDGPLISFMKSSVDEYWSVFSNDIAKYGSITLSKHKDGWMLYLNHYSNEEHFQKWIENFKELKVSRAAK